MANVAGTFLDLDGLAYFLAQLEKITAGAIAINGRTITLNSLSGTALGSVTVPTTIYNPATASADGLLTASDFSKLQAISEGATKVSASTDNGYILIDGTKTKVYTPPTVTALTSGLYKITVNANGYVTAGEAVKKSDITSLGIPAQDTTYSAATASSNGLLTSSDYTKIQGISSGAQVNVVETVKVNGTALPVTSKAVNIDLSDYALKADIASAVNYKGSVDSYADLPSNPTKGDMYNVATADPSHELDAGDNVVWTGSEWDVLSGMITIDSIASEDIDKIFA
jgi:hypothetical protein